MADADEDSFPSRDPTRTASSDPEGSDSDGDSDAAPDYGLLSTMSKKHSLPSRGIKDFEPAPTTRQAKSLEKSRTDMYDALSVIRVHNNRDAENVGVYFPDSADWDGARYEEAALLKVEDLEKRQKIRDSSALKVGEGRCVAVHRLTTTFTKTMGQMDRRSWSWLLPEEALFLLERGTLDIRYTADVGEDANANDGAEGTEDDARSSHSQPQLPVGDVPMSLQGAYAAFLGKSGLTLERYLVYANLRRGGYIVSRASTWHGPTESCSSKGLETEQTEVETNKQITQTSTEAGLVYRLLKWSFSSPPKPRTVPCYNSVTGPLLGPGLFRIYGDIYRQLHLILVKKIESQPATPPVIQDAGAGEAAEDAVDKVYPAPPLLPTWILHKPTALQNYKKSAPPPPHYSVIVLDARHSFVPTSKQIGDVLAIMPEDLLPNAPTKRMENRIKHGKRHAMLAVVDSGLISYMRFSSDGFGPDNVLWEENERRGQRSGSKRGGFRGRGRGGRGRGRGR